MTVTTYTSGSGTWTCPAGVLYVDVVMKGGGGGGGAGADSNIVGGTGGGEGSTTTLTKQAVTPGTGYSYSVGDGGDGHAPDGSSSVVTGHAGNASSMFSTSANGGAGGGSNAPNYDATAGNGTGGGAAGSGNYYGGPWTSGGNGTAGSGAGGGGTGSYNSGSVPGIPAVTSGNGGSGYITITYVLPTIAFNGVGTGSSDPPAGAKPMTVDWTNDTTNGTTWAWQFPGANTTSSTDEEPANSTYASSGNYDVTLTAYNAYGWSSLTKAGYITVYGVPFNRALFIMADHHRGR